MRVTDRKRNGKDVYQCLRMHFVPLSHPSCYNLFLIEIRSFHHTRHTLIFLLHYITSNAGASLGFENLFNEKVMLRMESQWNVYTVKNKRVCVCVQANE